MNNVGYNLLNHGFSARAMDVLKEILGIKPDHRGALNGLCTARVQLQGEVSEKFTPKEIERTCLSTDSQSAPNLFLFNIF